MFAFGIDTLAKVSLGSQSPNPVFVGGNSDVSVQIDGRGKNECENLRDAFQTSVLAGAYHYISLAQH